MAPDDPEDTESALWRRAVDHLVAAGARPAEALEGATLILGAYRRRRVAYRGQPASPGHPRCQDPA
jgi:hypothetical protein